MAIKLKKLTAEEQSAIDKLARSRTAPARAVERAQIILLARRGTRVPAIAKERELTEIHGPHLAHTLQCCWPRWFAGSASFRTARHLSAGAGLGSHRDRLDEPTTPQPAVCMLDPGSA
jgi:hypothetical protein